MRKSDIEKRLEKYLSNAKPGITDRIHVNGKCMVFTTPYVLLALTQEVVPNTLLPLNPDSSIPQFIVDELEKYKAETKSYVPHKLILNPTLFKVLSEFPDLHSIMFKSYAAGDVVEMFNRGGEYAFIGVAKGQMFKDEPELNNIALNIPDLSYLTDVKPPELSDEDLMGML